MAGPFTFPVAQAVPYDDSDGPLSAGNVKDALDQSADIANAAVFTIPLVYNGTLSGTEFVSYSNLTPNSPIIVPIDCKFVGYTFSNSNSGADYTFEFRNNTDAGAAYYSVSKTNTQFFAETLVTPETFSAGDYFSLKYIDNGTNSSDAVWILTFKAIP